MEPRSEPTNTLWSFPLRHRTGNRPRLPCKPMPTLSDEVAQLHDRVETLEAGSHRIPRPRPSHRHRIHPIRSLSGTRRQQRPAKRVGNQAIQTIARCSAVHRSRRSGLSGVHVATPRLPDHAVPHASGNRLPAIAMEVTHWVLHQGWCVDCGRWTKAQVPAEHVTGYGPRFSALMGLAGSMRERPTYRANVLCRRVASPVSFGAIQKVLDRLWPRPLHRTIRRLPRRCATQNQLYRRNALVPHAHAPVAVGDGQ